MKKIKFKVWSKGTHEPKDSWFYIASFLMPEDARNFISKRNNEGEVFKITKETIEIFEEENFVIGDRIIEMSESDFIELYTRLGNDIDVCPFEGKCIHDCTKCWAKWLSKFIRV